MSEAAPDESAVMATLTAWDVTVLAVALAISAGIGIFYRFTGGRQRTAREFLMADGDMSVTPVTFSLMASFMSAVSLLGVPKENYFFGKSGTIYFERIRVATPTD